MEAAGAYEGGAPWPLGGRPPPPPEFLVGPTSDAVASAVVRAWKAGQRSGLSAAIRYVDERAATYRPLAVLAGPTTLVTELCQVSTALERLLGEV